MTFIVLSTYTAKKGKNQISKHLFQEATKRTGNEISPQNNDDNNNNRRNNEIENNHVKEKINKAKN